MTIDGILVINKPAGPTSHDIVARVRRILGIKVGHTGTLDPMATGVLPLVLGEATRLSRFYQSSEKEYQARIRLGQNTDTDDAQGQVTRERPVPSLDDARAREALTRFVGETEQRAPAYSAVKISGRKLYEYARKGRTVERPIRRVTISRLELIDRDPEVWTIQAVCSAGTYIRSLARDLGEQLGCGAHVESLVRGRSGEFTLERSISPDDVADRWQEAFVPMERLLPEMTAVELDSDQARRAIHGNEVIRPAVPRGDCRLLHQGRLLAIAESDGICLRPRIVLGKPLRGKH